MAAAALGEAQISGSTTVARGQQLRISPWRPAARVRVAGTCARNWVQTEPIGCSPKRGIRCLSRNGDRREFSHVAFGGSQGCWRRSFAQKGPRHSASEEGSASFCSLGHSRRWRKERARSIKAKSKATSRSNSAPGSGLDDSQLNFCRRSRDSDAAFLRQGDAERTRMEPLFGLAAMTVFRMTPVT
jgi:hypothetical protein